MQTTFQMPEGFHSECNEDGKWFNHAGYEKVLCQVCHKKYIEAKGILPTYNCGDPKCNQVK
jgi:hypothetical protein